MTETNDSIQAETAVAGAEPALVAASQAQNQAPQVSSVIKQAWNDLDKVDEIKQGSENLKNAIIDIAGAKVGKSENVDIYAMPKEFQKHNAVAGSKHSLGLMVMSGALLLLLLVGSGAVLYYLKPELLAGLTGNESVNNADEVAPVIDTVVEMPVVAVTTTTESVATSTEDLMAMATPARDVYLAYNIELARVNTFADYFNLVNKYGSERRVQQIEAEKMLADVASDKGVSRLAEVKKAVPVLDPLAKITDKEGELTMTLQVALPDNESSGVVDMIWEKNAWKLDNENWQLAVIEEPIIYSTGQDRDNDGLTDKEEDLFSANKESSDSDGDGYSDAVEVAGLYDPNKKAGKLVDSDKFVSYLADDGSYSLIRPGEWSQSKDNTDNSVNFHSQDDQVIKIAALENYARETLDSIYLKQLNLTQIDSVLRIANDTWTGIFSPDANKLYLVSKLDRNKYYVVEYRLPKNSNVLEYKALFGAMIKSLVLKK